MDIMCGDQSLAEARQLDDGILFTLKPDVPDWVIPKGLFPDGTTEVTMVDVIKWAESRVFPEERIGAKELLAEIGLNSYDPWLIAKAERASQVSDGYWLKLEPTDTYETHCARGRLGMKPLEW